MWYDGGHGKKDMVCVGLELCHWQGSVYTREVFRQYENKTWRDETVYADTIVDYQEGCGKTVEEAKRDAEKKLNWQEAEKLAEEWEKEWEEERWG
jgi:hypothetical protein